MIIERDGALKSVPFLKKGENMTLDKKKVVYQFIQNLLKTRLATVWETFRGIIENLPYLKELGVDMIWLNPSIRVHRGTMVMIFLTILR